MFNKVIPLRGLVQAVELVTGLMAIRFLMAGNDCLRASFCVSRLFF